MRSDRTANLSSSTHSARIASPYGRPHDALSYLGQGHPHRHDRHRGNDFGAHARPQQLGRRLFHERPDPTASDVEAARVKSTTSTRAEIDRVTNKVVFPALVHPSADASGSKDLCNIGQHNWKINDSYDLACSQDRDAIVGFDGETFRAQALALHEALLADGWVPTDLPLNRVVTEYWDAYASPSYGVSQLPEARYTRPGTQQLITVDWLDSTEADLDTALGNPWGDVAVSYEPVDKDTVRAALVGKRYAVTVRISTTYCRSDTGRA